jgi:mRNA-degrading endonuclease RelE of RelBE toxin-antitoxin system
MSFDILLGDKAREYLSSLDEKSTRIVKDNLKKLADEPYPRPDAGSGDREKLVVDGEEMYRLHVGRTHTAFYLILDDEDQVRIVNIMTIDEAHKRYGF